MALPHHDTTHGDERRSRETPLFGPKETRDGDITASADLTIGLHGHPSTQVVQNQRLVRLSQPQLHGVLDTSPARSAGTAVVARDEDVVGLRLRDTAGNDTDTDLGYKFHRHAGAGVGALKIVDELLQILDGIDIVMGRGRNETDSSGGVTGASDRARESETLCPGSSPPSPGPEPCAIFICNSPNASR